MFDLPQGAPGTARGRQIVVRGRQLVPLGRQFFFQNRFPERLDPLDPLPVREWC